MLLLIKELYVFLNATKHFRWYFASKAIISPPVMSDKNTSSWNSVTMVLTLFSALICTEFMEGIIVLPFAQNMHSCISTTWRFLGRIPSPCSPESTCRFRTLSSLALLNLRWHNLRQHVCFKTKLSAPSWCPDCTRTGRASLRLNSSTFRRSVL